MKRTPPDRSRASALAPIIIVLLVCVVPLLVAQAPSWWGSRGVVTTAPASDFAAANQGQLKTFALAAYEEFLAKIPAALDGIGPSVPPPPNPALPESPTNRASPGWRLRNLISQWVQIDWLTGAVLKDGAGKPLPAVRPPGAPTPTDFAAINLGQIKAVTAPFYDRLAELYWSYNSGTPPTSTLDPAWAKPWTDATTDDNNHAMANLGQLKRAFALDLDSDADSDGLSNLAELLANANRGTTAAFWTDLGNAYSTGGQLTDGQQVALNLDPTNPANALPPTPPTGLRITFPDATVHPEDPDLSQIRVEWNPPSEPNIAASFSETYSGSSGGWGTPVTLSPNVTSRSFSGLLSKRVYGYRVTFVASNGLSSSSEIAYELPVIRGLMLRTNDSKFDFGGAKLYTAGSSPAIPRKFRTITYHWELHSEFTETFDTEFVYRSSTDVYNYTGDHQQTIDLATGTRHIENTIHSDGTITWDDSDDPGREQDLYGNDEHLSLAFVAPMPASPTGSVMATPQYYKKDAYNGTYESSKDYKFNLTLSLSRFPEVDAAGNAQPWWSYGALSGSFNLYDSDGYTDSDPEEYRDVGTISLQQDAGGQYASQDGVLTHKIGASTESLPYHWDHGWMPSPPGPWSGFAGDFSVGELLDHRDPDDKERLGLPPPEGADVTTNIHPTGTSWSRSWNYEWSTDDLSGFTREYTETWTETATLAAEITTEELVAASVASFGSFDSLGVDWYRPYTSVARYRLTNAPLDSSIGLNLFQDWDYTASYTSGTAGVNLATVGGAGKSFVSVEPQIGALVGQYSLSDSLSAAETSGSLLASEYKFRLYPPAESCEIVWEETFTPDQPDPVPPGWTPDPQYRVRALVVSPGQTETAVQSVDRTEGFLSQSGAPPNTEAQQAAPPATRVPGSVILGNRIAHELKLRVDRNHNATFDDGDDLVFAKYPMGLVVDVNNILPGGSTIPRNADATLSHSEKNSDLGYAPGQRVEPLLVNLPIGIPATVRLHVRNPDSGTGAAFPNDFPEGNDRIRLFTGHDIPAQAISPTERVYTLTEQERKASVKFWIEGTEPGEVIIDLEYTFMVNDAARTEVRRVRFEVNVDNPPKNPLQESNKLEKRNRVHAVKRYPRVTGIAANFSRGMEPLLTWHKKPRSRAYASTWIGFETDPFPSTFLQNPQDPNSTVTVSSLAWAQGGLFAWTIENQTNQQGAKPYAEIAVDYRRYLATKIPAFYSRGGALNALPAAGDRKWWNMPFRLMYVQGATPGHDQIIVRTNGFGNGDAPGAPQTFRVAEDRSHGVTLANRQFVKVQAGFESAQSVTRVPGVLNNTALLGEISVALGPTAATVSNNVITPFGFGLINLNQDDLEIIAVANNGDEVKRAREYSHYRIDLEGSSSSDVILWDKYYWMQPDNSPTGNTTKSPTYSAKPGYLWLQP